MLVLTCSFPIESILALLPMVNEPYKKPSHQDMVFRGLNNDIGPPMWAALRPTHYYTIATTRHRPTGFVRKPSVTFGSSAMALGRHENDATLRMHGKDALVPPRMLRLVCSRRNVTWRRNPCAGQCHVAEGAQDGKQIFVYPHIFP